MSRFTTRLHPRTLRWILAAIAVIVVALFCLLPQPDVNATVRQTRIERLNALVENVYTVDFQQMRQEQLIAERDEEPRTIDNIYVRDDPYATNTRSLYVYFTTEQPATVSYTVNVRFADLKISVIGEVARPGVFEIDRDKISIFDALALAGDMTVYGVRNEVVVARETNGVRTFEILDLTSKEIFNSPAFYLQQNDVVYVKPNKYKAQAGEISQNRSFYLSLVGTAISLATLIITLTK